MVRSFLVVVFSFFLRHREGFIFLFTFRDVRALWVSSFSFRRFVFLWAAGVAWVVGGAGPRIIC